MKRNLLLAAAATGLLCGLWAGVAPLLGLSIWAGFAACTAFFATGLKGGKAFAMTVATTLVGVLTAVGMIYGGNMLGGKNLGVGIAVGVIVALIVLMGQVKWLAFVPGIFVGCYSTFAILTGDSMWGDIGVLVLSLLAGALLGLACAKGGDLLAARFGDKEPAQEPAAA